MIARLLRVMNSETEPSQISLAFCLGMVLGFTPLASLHNILVLFIVLVLRVNISGFILSFIVLSGVAWLLDPLFHAIGLALLTAPALEGLWTAMYNSTLFRLARFNNTVVMGSVAASLALFVPVFLVSNVMIRKYRESFLEWVRKTHLMQAFRASKLYRVYASYSELRG